VQVCHRWYKPREKQLLPDFVWLILGLVARSVLHTPVSIDFSLWAIVCQLKDYRVCWHLNKALGLDLERKEDLEVTNSEGRTLWFSLFSYIDRVQKVTFFIFNNRCDNEYLVPELRGNDFFLMIKGVFPAEDAEQVFQKLLALPELQAVFRINPAKLASVHNLVIDDEEF